MSIMKGIYAAIVSNASIIVANTLTAGQQTMANSNPVALASNQSVGDPCTFQAKTMTTVSVNTATALIVPGVSGKLIYVCYDKVLDGAAEEVSLVEGTATGGSLKAVDGSTTVAQGNPLAANGGWSSGAGIGTVAQTASPSSNLLVLKSGTATAVIRTTYVQQ